jgi:hypothetical protein
MIGLQGQPGGLRLQTLPNFKPTLTQWPFAFLTLRNILMIEIGLDIVIAGTNFLVSFGAFGGPDLIPSERRPIADLRED